MMSVIILPRDPFILLWVGKKEGKHQRYTAATVSYGHQQTHVTPPSIIRASVQVNSPVRPCLTFSSCATNRFGDGLPQHIIGGKWWAHMNSFHYRVW